MPSLKGYVEKTGTLPECITASFAFYIAFYNGQTLTDDGLIGNRGTNDYVIKDDRNILEFYAAHKDDSEKDLVHAVCTNETFWGEDLTKIPGFEMAVVQYLEKIREKGTYEVMKSCL